MISRQKIVALSVLKPAVELSLHDSVSYCGFAELAQILVGVHPDFSQPTYRLEVRELGERILLRMLGLESTDAHQVLDEDLANIPVSLALQLVDLINHKELVPLVDRRNGQQLSLFKDLDQLKLARSAETDFEDPGTIDLNPSFRSLPFLVRLLHNHPELTNELASDMGRSVSRRLVDSIFRLLFHPEADINDRSTALDLFFMIMAEAPSSLQNTTMTRFLIELDEHREERSFANTFAYTVSFLNEFSELKESLADKLIPLALHVIEQVNPAEAVGKGESSVHQENYVAAIKLYGELAYSAQHLLDFIHLLPPQLYSIDKDTKNEIAALNGRYAHYLHALGAIMSRQEKISIETQQGLRILMGGFHYGASNVKKAATWSLLHLGRHQLLIKTLEQAGESHDQAILANAIMEEMAQPEFSAYWNREFFDNLAARNSANGLLPLSYLKALVEIPGAQVRSMGIDVDYVKDQIFRTFIYLFNEANGTKNKAVFHLLQDYLEDQFRLLWEIDPMLVGHLERGTLQIPSHIIQEFEAYLKNSDRSEDSVKILQFLKGNVLLDIVVFGTLAESAANLFDTPRAKNVLPHLFQSVSLLTQLTEVDALSEQSYRQLIVNLAKVDMEENVDPGELTTFEKSLCEHMWQSENTQFIFDLFRTKQQMYYRSSEHLPRDVMTPLLNYIYMNLPSIEESAENPDMTEVLKGLASLQEQVSRLDGNVTKGFTSQQGDLANILSEQQQLRKLMTPLFEFEKKLDRMIALLHGVKDESVKNADVARKEREHIFDLLKLLDLQLNSYKKGGSQNHMTDYLDLKVGIPGLASVDLSKALKRLDQFFQERKGKKQNDMVDKKLDALRQKIQNAEIRWQQLKIAKPVRDNNVLQLPTQNFRTPAGVEDHLQSTGTEG